MKALKRRFNMCCALEKNKSESIDISTCNMPIEASECMFEHAAALN